MSRQAKEILGNILYWAFIIAGGYTMWVVFSAHEAYLDKKIEEAIFFNGALENLSGRKPCLK